MTAGCRKGLTVLALIYLSRFCIRENLPLPTAAGRYVAKTLFFLNRLTERRRLLSRGHLIRSLDIIFEEVYAIEGSNAPTPKIRTGIGVFIMIISIVAINWVLVFFQ